VVPAIPFRRGRTAGNRLGASACRCVGAAVRKPAKSTASAFPVAAGCHPTVLTLARPLANGSDPEMLSGSQAQRKTGCPVTTRCDRPRLDHRPAPSSCSLASEATLKHVLRGRLHHQYGTRPQRIEAHPRLPAEKLMLTHSIARLVRHASTGENLPWCSAVAIVRHPRCAQSTAAGV
jgi:hypothetical protein